MNDLVHVIVGKDERQVLDWGLEQSEKVRKSAVIVRDARSLENIKPPVAIILLKYWWERADYDAVKRNLASLLR